MPSDDVEVSDVMPEMVESCRSIGDATDAAMVSALAPGSCACDLDGREVDRRQRRNGQQPVGEDAEDDDRRGDQRGEHRAADAESRTSPWSGPALAWRGVTLDPLVSRSWPSITTVSPPSRPLSITVSAFQRRAQP